MINPQFLNTDQTKKKRQKSGEGSEKGVRKEGLEVNNTQITRDKQYMKNNHHQIRQFFLTC